MIEIDPTERRRWIHVALANSERVSGKMFTESQRTALAAQFYVLMDKIDELHEKAFPTF